MENGKLTKSIMAVVAIAVLGGSALGQLTPDKDQLVEQPKPYSPYVDQHFPQRVFFGDTHFHSSLSVDSGLIGNKLDLDQAFRFARGEEIRTSTGQRAKLIRPLDFLVVSDHAEYLGIADLLISANPELLATEAGRKWYQAMQAGGDTAIDATVEMIREFGGGKASFRNRKLE
ncbi:MAG: DUF3604 domain-containing protein, partial [Candidatus Krumholzibacteria bacterium]